MIEETVIKKKLENMRCPRCGASMEKARLETIRSSDTILIAHAVCAVCKAESVITITKKKSGVIPVKTDLIGNEFKKFINATPISVEELLELHVALKKENIWSLMQKTEKNSEKAQKA